jgi:glycosyltransferase involved in cell wall biosynthesis
LNATARVECRTDGPVARAAAAPIRVAHLIHTMAYGGIETAVINWLKTIDRSAFEVYLFCFANPHGTEAPFVEAAHKAGIEVRRIPWSRRKPVLRTARVMAREVERLGIQILHCHNTYAQLVAIATARLTPVRTITTIYVWGNFGWKRAVLQWIDRLSLRLVDRISVHCEATFAETIRRGIPAEKLCLLTCGFTQPVVTFPAAERDLRRAELGASPEDFVLINVARFWPEKAHDVLLKAFQLVQAGRPNTRLWIAGVGPLESEIRSLCEALQLNQATRFLGFRPDLPELLALADMQVHPSNMEGVPLAVCSGMAAGLPIVATRVGGLLDILKDGYSAVLVDPGDPGGFAEAILRLIDDGAKRSALGLAARRFMEDEYSLAAATARVETVYREMARS